MDPLPTGTPHIHESHHAGLLRSETVNCFRNSSASRKSVRQTADQNIGINESDHARIGPLFSNLCPEAAAPSAPMDACGGVRSLGRTNGAVILYPGPAVVSLEE